MPPNLVKAFSEKLSEYGELIHQNRQEIVSLSYFWKLKDQTPTLIHTKREQQQATSVIKTKLQTPEKTFVSFKYRARDT